mmetsp:Transcript_18447/g.41369  ORF Transcript_18447/g.41369 Transcript_18447/m.41369 type:complete len:333 (+) Transcript_18447:130-1128(+)
MPPSFGARAKDPLMAAGGSRLAAANGARVQQDAAKSASRLALRGVCVAAGPSALFAAALFVVGRFYHHWPCWVLLCLTMAAAKALFVLVLFRGERWQRWLGQLLLVAACTGAVAGIHVYYSHLIFYYYYQEAPRFAEVGAWRPAALLSDAGMLRFTSDTRIDAAQSVGYQSADLGVTLCVAPIVDGAMGPSDSVSFFAVGEGCCAWRGRFDCDDASDATARAGLLLPQVYGLNSPLAAWALEDPVRREGFMDAVHLQQAQYGTAVSEKPRLLRWTRDPLKLQNQYLRAGLLASAGWCVLFMALASSFGAATAASGAGPALAGGKKGLPVEGA